MIIYERVPKNLVKVVTKQAKKLGLDKLDDNAIYDLHKISSKNQNPNGIQDRGYIDSGFVQIIGDKGHTMLYISGRGFSWYRTSPILKFEQDGEIFKFETENSTYELRGSK